MKVAFSPVLKAVALFTAILLSMVARDGLRKQDGWFYAFYMLMIFAFCLVAMSCRHVTEPPCMRTDTAWSQDCAIRFIITSPCQGQITVDNTRRICP